MKDMDYNELTEIVREEGIINLKDVSFVFRKLVEADSDDFEEYSYINSVRKKLRDLARMVNDEKWKVFADDEDYHNLAVDYARENLYDCALWILERGLKCAPSPDLLADKILYGSESGQYKFCEEAYACLSQLDRESWGWRAYSFTIKYCLKRARTLPKGKVRNDLKAEAYALAEDFIRYAQLNPEDAADRAYYEKASLVKELGPNVEGSNITQESVLKDGCSAIKSAPQCALTLADIMFERGDYDETLSLLNQCRLAINSSQPSISPAYVYLLYAMAKTAKLIKENQDGEFSEKESEIKSIYRDFHTVINCFDINITYKNAANQIIKVLEVQTQVVDTFQSLSVEEYV